ncbi:unnamed protein product [Adineta ricciae]|uniref:Carbohydrate sulfotransferase n=1 Tax=Adineta ricciae TaxID=249248 RepID=A0A815DU53_ADIRI|nr:unnamed protein product [Adineta ricciae]CAF1302263.1 unnamed protein product [Adineta ricciae]
MIKGNKFDVSWIIVEETDPNTLLPCIHKNRSQFLNNECIHSKRSISGKKKHTFASLVQEFPWLRGSILSLQSHSLAYCAIPKIASKSFLTLMIYVYIRDAIDHVDTNWTNIVVNKARAEQLINIQKLHEGLRKNGIPLPEKREEISVTSLIQIFLHLLRFSSINSTSPTVFLNPHRLNLKDIFPHLNYNNTNSSSDILSPSFTRVLFVRHPFERLVSAYKERIATLGKDRIQQEPYYDALRKIICYRYSNKNQTQRSDPKPYSCQNVIPSFKHFVQYILNGIDDPSTIIRMDAHWQPYTTICQVCNIGYNFIGKYESFNDDFTSLLKRLNVSDWNTQHHLGASDNRTEEYRRMYSSLPNQLICGLVRLYKNDLLLFNYQIEDYVNRTMSAC